MSESSSMTIVLRMLAESIQIKRRNPLMESEMADHIHYDSYLAGYDEGCADAIGLIERVLGDLK